MRRRDLFRKRDRRYFDFSGVTKVEPIRTNNYKYNTAVKVVIEANNPLLSNPWLTLVAQSSVSHLSV